MHFWKATLRDPSSFFKISTHWHWCWKKCVHPLKQTWNLKMNPWKRRFLLKTIIFRFHVSFRGCSWDYDPKSEVEFLMVFRCTWVPRGPLWKASYNNPTHYSYCWWKKSCTSWYGRYPIIYRVSYIPGGAGFQPSTVVNLQSLPLDHYPKVWNERIKPTGPQKKIMGYGGNFCKGLCEMTSKSPNIDSRYLKHPVFSLKTCGVITLIIGV